MCRRFSEVLPIVERFGFGSPISNFSACITRDAESVAATVSANRDRVRALYTRLLPDVGDVSRRLGNHISACKIFMVFQMQLEERSTPCS